MSSRKKKFARTMALILIPGTKPAYLAYKTVKYRKNKIAQNNVEE